MTWDYRAPRWLPGGHAQTIHAALWARRFTSTEPVWRRERWDTPDDDFIDVDWLVPAQPPTQPDLAPPLLVLFHGLEGSSRSHYAQALADHAARCGWGLAVPHFRGCSGELNRAPRAYHSGDHQEISWILERMRSLHSGPLYAMGVSLGGNALLRWAEETGHSARQTVQAVCAVCSPIDLSASGHAIGQGINRQLYTRMFLRSMKPRALQKWAQFPGLFDRDALLAAKDLYDFDNVFTAPLHGFRNTDDYWHRASAKPHLSDIRLPALVLNARNDPFVPAKSLPTQAPAGGWVTLWQPEEGGHVGFPQGAFPGHVVALPKAVATWLHAQ